MQREMLPGQSQLLVWHSQVPVELCERINRWRQQVEVCNSTCPPSSSQQLQDFCRETLPPLSSTPRATRRHKPYSRTRHCESSHINVSEFHVNGLDAGLGNLNEYGLCMDAVKVQPRVVDGICEASCRTPTTRDHQGMDLPHPEHNPLVS